MAISSDTITFIGIALLVGLIVILFIHFKPYFEKHDTTLLFIGGLGSGKTLNSVNKALFLYRKTVYWWKIQKLKVRVKNLFRSKKNKMQFNIKKPLLYSNIPILIKSSLNPAKRVYSTVLTKEHLTLKSRLREFSIVLIDEAPLLVNQFNWSNEEVKNNLNEFIAMFRHYVGGT